MEPVEHLYRWLLGPQAAPWLQSAVCEAPHTALKRLRRELSPEQSRLVLELAELRQRGRQKFSRAGRMGFTRRLLEQATGEDVARCKAARFPRGEAVVDLCCGCGGDLIALAQRGVVEAVDIDPLAALLAEHNCRAYDLAAEVRTADAAACRPRQDQLLHIDPDRRASGRRATRLESFAPDQSTLDRLRRQAAGTAIKLAPATEAADCWAQDGERQWIGSGGQCRQQVIWFGCLARSAGRRVATVCAADAEHSLEGSGQERAAAADQLDEFLFEPHAAVLAAHLEGALAAQHSWSAAAPGGAYLTGAAACITPLATAYQVLEALPFDQRRVRHMLARYDVGRLEVKRRGVPDTPEEIARRLRTNGSRSAVLIVTRLPRGVVAALCRRAAGVRGEGVRG